MMRGHHEQLGNVELKNTLFIFPMLALWLYPYLSEKSINNTQSRQSRFCMEKSKKWLVNQLET